MRACKKGEGRMALTCLCSEEWAGFSSLIPSRAEGTGEGAGLLV